MAPEEIEAKIKAVLPDAQIVLKDLTGTRDHWEGLIISAAFEGKSPIQRQRLVLGALAEEMKGPIHAFTFETLTPDQASQ